MKTALTLVGILTLLSAPLHAEIVECDNTSNFNGTSIAAGSWIWFSANFKYQSGPQNANVLVEIDDAFIEFSAGGVDYTIPVPNSAITQIPNAAAAVLDFNEGTTTWENSLPFSGDDIFMTGVAWQVPVDLPGGINPVNFHARFRSDNASVKLNWKWGAAVYSNLTDVYDDLNVQPVHDGPHAGTPSDPWRDFVIGGARGGGGSNWTGSWSGSKTVFLNEPVANEDANWGGVKALFD